MGRKNDEPKGCYWGGVIYPESAPENYLELISNLHMKALLSPLHDNDINRKTGEILKPHYHLVLVWDGPTQKSTADKVMEQFCGTKSAERIRSIQGYARYLAHMDDPDKAQYDPTEIRAFGGIDLAELLRPGRTGRYKTIGDIFDYVSEYEIVEFSALIDYARAEHPKDWLPVIIESAYVIGMYISSLRHSMSDRKN